MNRLALLLVLGACGSSSITSPNNDAPMQFEIDARTGPCTRASQCPPGNICNPADGMCVTTLPCTTHSECGGEAYCAAGGMCAPSVPHGPCDNDQNCIGQEACNPATHICGCGGQLLSTEIVAPNVLIAIDRSDSMNELIGGVSKWTIAKAAINSLVATFGDRVRFGLELWPGTDPMCSTGGECNPGIVNVDVGPGTATDISDALAAAHTCHFKTPIAPTLKALVSYAGLGDASRANYVLLVTDGAQNCDADGPPGPQATALRNRVPEVKTYAVGFGTAVDAAELNDIADKGGTARPGNPKYYQADDSAQLVTAFQSIIGGVLTCSYTLSTQPSDPGRLFVYFGGNQIPRDTSHTNGWDYDATSMQLTFYGTTCDQVRAGTAGALAVSYGCPIIP